MPRQSAFALARKHRPAALAAQKIFVFLSAARFLHGQPHRLVSGCGSNFISVPPVHRVRVCFPFLSMILTAAAAMQNLMCQNFFDLFFGDYNIYQIDSLDNLSARYVFDFGNKACKRDLDCSDMMSATVQKGLDESVVALYNFQETNKWLHLDFVYKGNVYSLFYSKTNDEVSVVDIKGCHSILVGYQLRITE